jgi:hypothetical protein
MQYQRNGRTSEACGLIAREEIEEDGYTLESVECEAKEEMKRVPSLASDRKTRALAWCRGLCLGFLCLRMARVCPPFGTGGAISHRPPILRKRVTALHNLPRCRIDRGEKAPQSRMRTRKICANSSFMPYENPYL